uniref:Parathyroid hormone n=1 Tax=Cynoglossus semilaevis TaxID=244447 RepID=A0A3P8WYK5_CYNSE
YVFFNCLCKKSSIFWTWSSNFPHSLYEVQLMHNVREHKQVGERQDWLQEKLKDIIVSSAKPQHGRATGNIKNLFPNDVLGLDIWKH